MEEKHCCKLCDRSFACGRALGGHMRSHMMKLSLPSKQEEEQQQLGQQFYDDDYDDVQSCSSMSSPSSSSSEGQEVNNEHKKMASSDHLQDRESEIELTRTNPVCRRSKRVRKSRISNFTNFTIDAVSEAKKARFVKTARANTTDDYEHSSLMESSISDSTPEEHVAHCLIMLSKDKWTREDDNQGDNEEVMENMTSTNKAKAKYRCETCKKVFRSYQALGGHRASHNKVKVNAPEKFENSGPTEAKIHECPFCHRIFASGQALGGHKRSHLAAGEVAAVKSRGTIGEVLDIDLNLPAPTDDDETSQIDVSAVSDAEFVR